MNLDSIDRLARLVSELDLAEIEVKRLGEKIRIVRLQPSGTAQVLPLSPSPQLVETPAHDIAAQDIPPYLSAREQDSSPSRSANVVAIRAPMVGTFYSSPAPDAPPYVEVGQMLEVGQTVCIVEAMKLMNEIQGDVRGRIVATPVENAQPVEFGQTLMEVDTSATG